MSSIMKTRLDRLEKTGQGEDMISETFTGPDGQPWLRFGSSKGVILVPMKREYDPEEGNDPLS